VIESLPLSQHMGIPVYLKMDSVQPSGSFKIRGIGYACQSAVEKGATSLVTSSGGNAGKAVAYAGRMLKVPVDVVVPTSTSPYMRDLIKAEGANVTIHGAHWAEADAFARTLLTKNPSAAYIHPFDHPDIWEGNSTIIAEAAEQMDGHVPGAVVCVVGGGGLLCGIAMGMSRVGWDDVPIVAVETVGAHSFYSAVQAGELVTLPGITSVAKTLGAVRVCEEAFLWTKKRPISAGTVTDKEAVDACLRFADDHHVLVEASCGAGLAAVYEKKKELLDLQPRSLLVVVCGGSMCTISFLQDLQRQLSNSQ